MKPAKHLLIFAAIGMMQIAPAAPPSAINYQGRLTNAAGIPQPGVRVMSIKIFDAATEGALLYSETVGNVTVDANGVYGFQFGANGAGNPARFASVVACSAEQWLELTVDGGAQAPRQKIMAVPFALVANGLPDGTVTSPMIANGAVELEDLSPSVADSLAAGIAMPGASDITTALGYTPANPVNHAGTSGEGITAATCSPFLDALGGTTAGKALLSLPNPSSIRFLRINADNSVSSLDAASFLAAVGGIGELGQSAIQNAISDKSTFRTNLGLGTAATTDASTVGGANKTAQFDSTGRLRLGPVNTTDTNPPGALRIPSRQRIEWENTAGGVNGNVWMFTGHSGGDELVWTLARECHYWDEGFQLGQAGTARSQQYLYFHSLGQANLADPNRESTPVYFDGSYWTGSTDAASNVGIQWVPSGDHAGELSFSMTGSKRSYGASGKVANIPDAVKTFGITQDGPKIPMGKVLTFGDGTTLATKPDIQARTGNLTLIAGTKTIANSTVTSKTNVLLTRRSAAGMIGDLTYTTTPAVGFTVTSSSGADTSRISYLLVEDQLESNAPTISGTTAVTDVLTVASGGGSGSFQWFANAVPVPEATAATYAIRHQDIGLPITCKEDGVESNAIIAWKPGDEGGYFADYRADTGLLKTGGAMAANGEPVEIWQDQSGNSRHLTQTTGANQPLVDTATYAGFANLEFDAVNDSLNLSVILPRPYSVFLVAEGRGSNANRRFFSAGSSGSRMFLEQAGAMEIKNHSGLQTTGGQMPLNTRHIITGRTSGNSNSIRVDANAELTDGAGTTASGTEINVSQSAAGGGANCRVFSLLIYSSDLDGPAQERVRKYLKAKWGTP